MFTKYMHLERYGNTAVDGIEMGAPEVDGLTIEEKMVDELVTQHLVDKVVAKIKVEDGWTNKSIPRLLQTVYYDLITEELWDFLKRNKNPRLDFAFINRLTISKIKTLRKDLF